MVAQQLPTDGTFLCALQDALAAKAAEDLKGDFLSAAALRTPTQVSLTCSAPPAPAGPAPLHSVASLAALSQLALPDAAMLNNVEVRFNPEPLKWYRHEPALPHPRSCESFQAGRLNDRNLTTRKNKNNGRNHLRFVLSSAVWGIIPL